MGINDKEKVLSFGIFLTPQMLNDPEYLEKVDKLRAALPPLPQGTVAVVVHQPQCQLYRYRPPCTCQPALKVCPPHEFARN